VAHAATRRRRLLHRNWPALQFGDELPFGLKPVTHIVAVHATARDVELKRTVGNLYVGELGARQSRLLHYLLLQNDALPHPQFRTASASSVHFSRERQSGIELASGPDFAKSRIAHTTASSRNRPVLSAPGSFLAPPHH